MCYVVVVNVVILKMCYVVVLNFVIYIGLFRVEFYQIQKNALTCHINGHITGHYTVLECHISGIILCD